MVKAIIYTKICLPCVYKDGWALVQSWAGVNDITLQVRRTTYNPLFHRLATRAYGNDKYLAFVKIGRKKIRVSELIKAIKENNDDLHKLLTTRKSHRKNCMVVAKKKTNKKNEER